MTLDDLDDATAAAAFRRLAHHLQQRDDASNIDLMGLAGFCRNCLGDWVAEASGGALDKTRAREAVHGMSASDWKTRQPAATPDQLARMERSLRRNEEVRRG